MIPRLAPRQRAVLQALLVTFLWSTSWVLIKVGLREIPPLNFAAYRYLLASVLLLGALAARHGRPGRSLPWGRLLLLGLLGYTAAQGGQYLALQRIPAATGSFILGTIPLWAALLERLALGTRLRLVQAAGTLLCLAGSYAFFFPLEAAQGLLAGGGIMLLSGWASAGAVVLTRAFQLGPHVGALRLTALSMAAGSTFLLALAWAWEGIALPPASGWAIIAYLGVVNTAFAWTLWNHVLRTLTALETSVLANLMLLEIALLAWVFLGEGLGLQQWLGIGVLLGGVTLVHLPRASREEPPLAPTAVPEGE